MRAKSNSPSPEQRQVQAGARKTKFLSVSGKVETRIIEEKRMNVCRMLVIVGIVLIQVSGVNAQTSGLPPIFEVAKNCDDVQFAALLKKDISTVNKTLYDSTIDVSRFTNPYKNYTLLAFAAANGCTNIIQQLLDMDAEVNPALVSPLGEAAANGHMEAVKMLLQAKANPQKAMDGAVKNGKV